MKSLEEQMAFYAAYHSKTWNKILHFVGVPMLIFSILIPMGWLRISVAGIELTGALAFVVAVLGYYIVLDSPLAVAMAIAVAPLFAGADFVSRLPLRTGALIFTATFVGGWIVQLAGHAIEGRKPALVDNFFQVLVAPIFLMAELAFTIGLRRETQVRVREPIAAEKR